MRIHKFDAEISPNLKLLCQNKSFYIRTYGCQSNVRDSETISGILEQIGYTKTELPSNADLIILNTCAIRDNAEQKVFGEIGQLQKLKKTNPNLMFGICGCMVQQPEVVEKFLSHNWNIDLIFGTNNIHELPKLIEQSFFSKYPIINVNNDVNLIAENLPSLRESKIKAFVNIMFGCSNFCTYCIVPFTRGKERSRSVEDILQEVEELKLEGYKEITLLGQNVNNYGLDLKPQVTFSELLDKVAKTNVERIRFVTSNPWNFSFDLIDIIFKHKNICKYIHLPIQSGSNKILEKMNRHHTTEQYLDIINEIKKKPGDIAITTDIIVGFPNETQEEFEKTLELYDKVKFDNAYTFIYSKREGTPAAKWDDDVTSEEKNRRLQLLNEKSKYYAKKINLSYVGNTYEVLVDKINPKDPNNLSGYTDTNKLVHFKGENYLLGQIVKVKIVHANIYSLVGELYES